MILHADSLINRAEWEEKGYALPAFDIASMVERTKAAPAWVHFGPGNIFKAFPAHAVQHLLDEGLSETGLIAVGRRKKNTADHDNLTILVTLLPDGHTRKTVIGSIAETVCLYGDENRLIGIFENPSLQMVSFTITEKGYRLRDGGADLLPDIAEDLGKKPEEAKSYMGKIAYLLYRRYLANACPVAMVSMDNCSHNGDRLKEAMMLFAAHWQGNGSGDNPGCGSGNNPGCKSGEKCAGSFLQWLQEKVSFPWTMIDKITPAPDAAVAAMLEKDSLPAGTPFVNAEESEYLVIEDDFPNGRPPLEKTGFYLTSRETVDKAEHMKVCTCLNPLHTALAVFGCLLGQKYIWQEMQDEDLLALVRGIGYREGLPVVTDPGIIHPADFLDTVVKERFPNPFLPDTPQRIATDTSQKLPIRFGETIKAYLRSDSHDVQDLQLIPLVFAGWLRYLMGIDDNGDPFELSPDPLLPTVLPFVKGQAPGQTAGSDLGQQEEAYGSNASHLDDLLRNEAVFGVDLVAAGLAEKVKDLFRQLCEGPGAVRRTLHLLVQGQATN